MLHEALAVHHIPQQQQQPEVEVQGFLVKWTKEVIHRPLSCQSQKSYEQHTVFPPPSSVMSVSFLLLLTKEYTQEFKHYYRLHETRQ